MFRRTFKAILILHSIHLRVQIRLETETDLDYTEAMQYELHFVDTIDSTNNAVKALAQAGASEGFVLIADHQTAGRGRLGRGFYSPKDGLYLSIVIRPTFDMSRASQVTVAAAAATSESIDETCGCASQIKWVNDIYVNNKKVCGILTEATTDFETGQIDSLIIGIGINTSDKSFPPELADIAGSVSEEDLTGHEKAQLAASIIEKVLTLPL